MKQDGSPELDLQIKVSRLLARGFVFSIVRLGGIGSLIAFLSGLKALRIINKSDGKIGGSKLAWWCVVVGAFGVIMLPLVIISNFRK